MRIHYLEIVTPDVDAVCATCEKLHGVQFSEPVQELGNARTAALADGGLIGVRAPMHPEEEPVVRPYLLVDDIRAATRAAQDAGALIAHPPLEIPGLGTFAMYDAVRLLSKVALFFAVTIPVGLFVFPLLGRYFRYLRFPEVDFSMLLIAALAYAIFAERMDMHFIIGAFLAGMFFYPGSVPQEVYERVEQQMSGITRGFLAPIFFVSVGLHLDFSAIAAAPGFVVVLILIALLSKFVGAGLPAYWVGLSKAEALMVGVGMSGRGAVELIVAGVALQAGLFLQPSPQPPIVASMYSSIVIMALVTTVLTPLILRRLVDRER